jgi:hypothetical protein
MIARQITRCKYDDNIKVDFKEIGCGWDLFGWK